jgi:hypothetical protein
MGDADFCRDRAVVVLQEPEAPAVGAEVDVLSLAVNMSLQVGEERLVTYKEDEVPVVAQVEKASGWESDADVYPEFEGAVRGLSSPALTSEEEQRVEQYLRVVTPEIKAMFRKPVWDMTGIEYASATDVRRCLDEYGARCEEVERAEQEYRANREQAKVWKHAREEEKRCKEEEAAEQARIWRMDVQRGEEEAMKRSEEERKKEEKRRKKEEKRQLEEQKRIEAEQQLEEKRRKAEAKKKEEKERREEERQKTEEEARRIRRKEVDAATAKAKKEREELNRNKELKARLSAEEYDKFLVNGRERELMLAKEAKKQWSRKSEEADRAREAKAKKD